MAIQTKFSVRFDLRWPIVCAPMAGASGGKLAAQVTLGGGYGLIGGAYGDSIFINKAWEDAGNSRVGIGFITWSLEKQPHLLNEALEHAPDIVMLSFGDPAIFSKQIKDAGAALMCQCQTMAHVKSAISAGAEIIVAQGAEAGGHGASRSTLPFVREAADYIKKLNLDCLLLAAGGIGDGQAIAASLILGADGVLVGSRYWASKESLVHSAFQQAALKTNGDHTLKTSIPDIARNLDWPDEFDIRVLENKLTDTYHHRRNDLSEAEKAHIADAYLRAAKEGNVDEGGIIVGEVVGILNDIPGACELTEKLGRETETALTGAGRFIS